MHQKTFQRWSYIFHIVLHVPEDVDSSAAGDAESLSPMKPLSEEAQKSGPDTDHQDSGSDEDEQFASLGNSPEENLSSHEDEISQGARCGSSRPKLVHIGQRGRPKK